MSQKRVALVTGGGRGIGRAVALALAKDGALVTVLARTQGELDETAKLIRAETGADVHVVAADVVDYKAVDAAVHEVVEKYGRLDIVVTAAGIIQPVGPIETTSPEDWERVFRVNVFGTYTCIRAVLPSMKKQGSGTILTFSGGGALQPFPHFSAYGSSKAAVVRLTETVAAEVRSSGITVNAIAPGAINTQMFADIMSTPREQLTDAQWNEFEQRRDKGGEDVGRVCDLVRMLISERGRRITGRVISAQWDPWATLPEHIDALEGSDVYTLRRMMPKDRGYEW